MNNTDYELLSQYLDAELAEAPARSLEQRLLNESELAARLEQMRLVDNTIRTALSSSASVAVPPHIEALLAPTSANVFKLPIRRRNVGLALAASMVAAAGLWLAQVGQQQGTPDFVDNPAFARMLEQAPSRATGWNQLDGESRGRPVLSFAARDGRWCREFLFAKSESSQWRGVACRQQGEWRTQVVKAIETRDAAGIDIEQQAANYRPASAEDNNGVATFIGANAADIALGGKEEAGLIANAWE